MHYTYQTCSDSGSFSAAHDDECEHATNLRGLHFALENWQETHDRVGSDRQLAYLTVWRGRLEDVTNVDSAFVLRSGPRGGIVRTDW
jgi:hypothetical protein